MSEPLLVSVIIPCFMRPDLVRAAVESVFAQDLEKDQFELIVVDSSPDDQVIRVLEELRPATTCRFAFFHKKPEGPGPSRNLGAAHARAPLLALLDSDCIASPGWLRNGIAAFRDGIGLVQGRTLPEPGVHRGVFSKYVLVERESFIYEGCNMFFRRDVYLEFSEDVPDPRSTSLLIQGGEDVILAWKAKRGGWLSTFSPEALVHHKVLPITPWRWVYIHNNLMWPYLLRRIPELRPFFFGRFFFEPSQAWFTLALAAVPLFLVTKWAALLFLPYVVCRARERTHSLRGPLRLLRPLFYLPRDACNFFLLLRGSLRFRTILL